MTLEQIQKIRAVYTQPFKYDYASGTIIDSANHEVLSMRGYAWINYCYEDADELIDALAEDITEKLNLI